MKAKADERVLHPYDDVELWFAEADDKSWMLPLYVEWYEDRGSDEHFAKVASAGICFYPAQVLAINAMLRFHDIQGKHSQWVIPRRIAEALLHKAPGITVRRYYRWPGEDGPPIETKPPIATTINGRAKVNKPKVPSFVEWLSKETKISSSIINAVLNAVSHGATTWMVEHRKPLDLGFVRLVAVPFRANWKEIVAFKAKAQNLKLRTLFHLPQDKLWEALEDAGLPEILTSPHNVGIRRAWQNEIDIARIDYTIEAIPSNQFEAAASRIESRRIARGPAAYVADYEDAVESLYQAATSALRAYLRKVSMPFAQVSKSGDPSFIGFVPILGRKATVRGTPLCNLPVHVIASGSRFSVFGRNSDQFLISPPPSEVQEVPHFPQRIVDVRKRKVTGKLELTDGGEGANGMPVLSSGKGDTEGESVLVEPKDSDTWLDGEGSGTVMI